MSQCESTFTIDRYTGEKLRCRHEGGDKHPKLNVITGAIRHSAEYVGVYWYWNDKEQDNA